MVTINHALFNMVFPKLSDIRLRFVDIESVLSDSFLPGQCLPIPNDAPPEIPRMIFNSLNGHSTLSISSINAQLTVNFDSHFHRDLDNCYRYLSKKANVLIKLLGQFMNEGFLYSGLSINGTLDPLTADEDDSLRFMSNRFLNFECNPKPVELSSKLVFVQENKFYINLSFANTTLFNGIPQMAGSLMNLKSVGKAVTFDVDINDRYAFNYDANYRSTQESAEKVLSISRFFMENRLGKFIKEGVLEI